MREIRTSGSEKGLVGAIWPFYFTKGYFGDSRGGSLDAAQRNQGSVLLTSLISLRCIKATKAQTSLNLELLASGVVEHKYQQPHKSN